MIRAIPGFLGLDADWDFLRKAGFTVLSGAPAASPAQDGRRRDGDGFAGEAAGAPLSDVLLGYSMGGRIALELLLERRFEKAVIVSAGLGIEDESERAARRAADEQWARRFESDDFESVMRDWNAQPVFGGHVIDRNESDYDRAALARTLRQWSPGVQEPLAPRIHAIETPILWIAGERDEKYVAVARRAVTVLPDAELWICPAAGHRVPWEQPERFAARLREFLE